MKKCRILRNGGVLIRRADMTENFFERFRGLMFANSIPDSYGLVISPCRQIHMFNMKFPLDVIYLSEENRVVDVDENMQPWTVGKTVKAAARVLEVNAGTCARCEICPGDVFEIEPVEASEGTP